MSDGSWTGLSGAVEDGDGKFALIAFGGRLRVKIATFLLERAGVEQTSPPVAKDWRANPLKRLKAS
jgi:hypothetical protein